MYKKDSSFLNQLQTTFCLNDCNTMGTHDVAALEGLRLRQRAVNNRARKQMHGARPTTIQQGSCRNKSRKLGLTLQNKAPKVGASQEDRLLEGLPDLHLL